ncbi:MAG: cation:proton antiporter [Treponema sp.]|jgi:Kef-type K+ transport system membrane component KefB/mannitol/fructose-specific phosphotransferase system IIA component (Ntr-type)|nr:cation:proton antiporter [Treponema sp.]
MEAEPIAEQMIVLILQLGIVIFAVRFLGKLVKKLGAPQVLGELVAGIIIGPYALGGITLPGFPEGIFPLGAGSLAVSIELYAFATVASIILLFVSGLETNIKLFIRYSLAGGIISTGGVLASFAAGAAIGMLVFQTSFTDPRCLFLGVLITSNSLGIVARLLSDQKKMDTPESVTILAASVFDDVLSIIALTVVLGVVAMMSGMDAAGGLHIPSILAIAGKAFGIWLGCTLLGLVFSKKLAFILKLFKSNFDFSVLALGIALILAGLFEKQGLAMIIGAYIAGLSLSGTDIAPVIQDRIQGIYELFVPVFFAVMGMMVNFRDIIAPQVLMFGAIYTAAALIAKLAGCGGPALLLGFNVKGALRIGLGMAPRGEMTLIVAGIGLAEGILSQQIFAVLILMILITTLAVPPLLTAMLKLKSPGTRKNVKGDTSAAMTWNFPTGEIADLVMDTLLNDLRDDGFYIQTRNLREGVSQARKDDISLSIHENENIVTIETSKDNMHFVKTAIYEVIAELYESVQKLKDSSDSEAMKKDLLESDGKHNHTLLSYIKPECTCISLKGKNKEEIITELVDMLAAQGRLLDRDMVWKDVLEREETISTGLEHGVAMPRAKSDGVDDLVVAVGIKKEGVDFGSMDAKKSRLFILEISPKRISEPHLQFLAAVSAVLADKDLCEDIINAASPEKVAEILRNH